MDSIQQLVKKNTDLVYQQLIPDFPGPALEWVKHTLWIGPVHVPLDAIDTANRANWTATHEPQKVKVHQQLIIKGESAPVILGALPGHDKFFIIDAHHRFLAYESLGLPVIAWIGEIQPAYIEAAMTAHSKQYTGKSRLATPQEIAQNLGGRP